MENKFAKLSEVSEITLRGVKTISWKKWDNEAKRMIVEKQPTKGLNKTYTLDTDKGLIDVSASAFGNILECLYSKKESFTSKINGATIKVINNGKTGIEIRYYFNFVRYEQDTMEVDDQDFPIEM